MSTQPTTVSAPYRAPNFAGAKYLLGRAVAAFGGTFRAIAAQYRTKRDIDQLKSLSDETLRDIGIRRPEIASLVHEKTHGGKERRHAHD